MVNEVTVSGRVVVGYDSSATSRLALAWGVDEARRRRVPLDVVHACPTTNPLAAGYTQWALPDEGHAEQSGREVLQDARDRACAQDPDIRLTTRLLKDHVTRGLLEILRDGDLAVVGSRGYGGFADLLLGSTGLQLANHAPCPVIVVRESAKEIDHTVASRIVVGVDESESSAEAISFAFEEASLRGLQLTALQAWKPPSLSKEWGAEIATREAHSAAAEEGRLLAEAIVGYGERYPDVEASREIVTGNPVSALVEASKNAALLVVGSRGRGGFRALLLGSVSHGALHYAHCPVAVVRHG